MASSTFAFAPPVLLKKGHDGSSFDCGKQALNEFLAKHALSNLCGGVARTYVVLAIDSKKIVGYYSQAPAAAMPEKVPDRVIKGQARHQVPCILLARLAVDRSAQDSGLGSSLFRDALRRALNAHERIGGRAFLVHAIDEEARRFYERYGMVQSPTDPLHLSSCSRTFALCFERRPSFKTRR